MIRPLRVVLNEYRAKVMLDAVLQSKGNVCEAARRLGCHRNLIYYEMRKHGLPLTSVKIRRVQMKLKLTAQRTQQT